jgi:hypothetical protein
VRWVGRDDVSGRELFVLDAARPDEVLLAALAAGPYFACLLAWDAREVSDPAIRAVAARVLRAGCVYVCCWGPGCERVHDLFDEADLALRPDGPWAMSTWHSEEPLPEALWFFLRCTWPDDASFEGCRAAVGVTVGSSVWAAEVHAALSAPDRFCARVLGSSER